MSTTATIFFNDAQWMAYEPCFDSRFDGQILPSGSVVVGFMSWDGREVKELLSPPAMNEAQEADWERVVGEARGLLLGLPTGVQ